MSMPANNLLPGPRHIPVMLDQVLALLAPTPGDTVFDGTVGLGGHAAALLRAVGSNGVFWGVDRDPLALEVARGQLETLGGEVVLCHDRFDRVLERPSVPSLNAILFDLGVSSMQLDCGERGFSFLRAGPLDMRMDPSSGPTAADLVNSLTECELSLLFSRYGEEPHARRVAKAVVRNRPILTTDTLAKIVAGAAGTSRPGVSPATRVFQALRIAVNDELGAIERALPLAIEKLAPCGRMAVITFHSLEDRIVKTFCRREATECLCPPRLPQCSCNHVARIEILTRKPVVPSEEEVTSNPRARSARLRVVRKTDRLAEDGGN